MNAPNHEPLTAGGLLSTNADEINKALTGQFVRLKISISRWDDAVSDPNLTDEILHRHGVEEKEAAKVIKRLMAGAPELKELNKRLSAVRTLGYQLSRRLDRDFYVVDIPSLPDAIKKLSEARSEAERAKEEFLATYDQRVAEAQAKLKSMASSFEYPSVDELRDRIGVSVEFTPLPDMRSFSHMNLPAEVAAQFAAQVGNQQRKMVETAISDLYSELVETVTVLATQFRRKAQGEKGVKLYDSRISQIKRLARQLQAARGIVSTDFSALETAVNELASMDYEAAKASTTTAGKLAEHAENVANKLKKLRPDSVGDIPQGGEIEAHADNLAADSADEDALREYAPEPEPTEARPEPEPKVENNPQDDPFAALDALFF